MKSPPPIVAPVIWVIFRALTFFFAIAAAVIVGIGAKRAGKRIPPLLLTGPLISVLCNSIDIGLLVYSIRKSSPIKFHGVIRLLLDFVALALIVTGGVLASVDLDGSLFDSSVTIVNTVGVVHIILIAFGFLALWPCCFCFEPYKKRKRFGSAATQTTAPEPSTAQRS